MNNKESLTHAIVAGSTKTIALGWGMIVLFVVFNAFGAMILKNQIQNLGAWHFASLRSVAAYFIALFSCWPTWMALISIGIGTGTWIMALAHLELSKAYPVAVGFNLLIVVAMSLFYFNEPLTFSKMLGTFLIFTGVIFIFR